MDTQDNETLPPPPDPYEAFKRLLAQLLDLQAHIAARERQERGEDGFDG